MASDAVRDQIARHNPAGGVFNSSYLNEVVNFNSQDAYLEEDISEDGLTRAFAHMSLRCHPGAPSGVPPELLRPLLAADPHIGSLEREFNELHDQIKATYRFINRAPEEKRQEHKHLQQRLKNAKKSLTDELNVAHRRDYFFRVHNVMMKMSLDQAVIEEPGNEPMVQHELEERNLLQVVLCDFSRDLTPPEIVSRKVTAITLLIALASRQEPQTRKPKSSLVCEGRVKTEPPLSSAPSLDPSPQPDEFPLILGKTQCIFCIGNERYTYEKRARAFKRVSHMWDHVENLHLKHLGQMIPCPHPVCMAQGLILNSVMYLKNHVVTVHKVNLRP